jgi:type IV pilus assembly protein PilE
MKRMRTGGFTLIELMIVVVIIGILAGIAYPSYQKYMKQTRRSDAQIALTRVAALQEKYYSDCSHFASKLEGTARSCGTASDYSDAVLAMNGNASTTILSDNRDYVITLVAPTTSSGGCPINTCFKLQATPATTANVDGNGNKGTGRQVGDGNFRIDSTGAKSWAKDGTNYNYKWTDK